MILQSMSEIDQYDYDLPRDLIAQTPLTRRADARLLIVDRATQIDRSRSVFATLHEILLLSEISGPQ